MTATMTRSPSGAFVIEGGTDAEGYELLIDVIGEFARRGYTNWTVEPVPTTPASPAGPEPRRDGARPFRAHPEECTARPGDNVPAVFPVAGVSTSGEQVAW